MAASKTAPFFISKTFEIPAGSAPGTDFTGEISVESFVDVASRQGLEILEVDYILQSKVDASGVFYVPFQSGANGSFAANSDDGSLGAQLLDQSSSGMVVASDRTLISSYGIQWDAGNNVWSSSVTDLFPDVFNKNTDGRITINDTLHIVGRLSGADLSATDSMQLTLKIKARVVTLTTTDFVSMSLTSIATDN